MTRTLELGYWWMWHNKLSQKSGNGLVVQYQITEKGLLIYLDQRGESWALSIELTPVCYCSLEGDRHDEIHLDTRTLAVTYIYALLYKPLIENLQWTALRSYRSPIETKPSFITFDTVYFLFFLRLAEATLAKLYNPTFMEMFWTNFMVKGHSNLAPNQVLSHTNLSIRY